MEYRYCVRTSDEVLVKAALEGNHVTFLQGLHGHDGLRFLRFSSLAAFGDGLAVAGSESIKEVIAQVAVSNREIAAKLQETYKERGKVGRDPRIASAEAWYPAGIGGGIFGDRRQAHALIGAEALRDTPQGEGVNVVIVDQGLNGDWLRGYRSRLGLEPGGKVHGWSVYKRVFGGGKWQGKVWRNAGSTRSAHGEMIARNVLALAPKARIWDLPLIADVQKPPGVSTARALLDRVRWAVKHNQFNGWRETPADDRTIDDAFSKDKPQRWVIVNAWGVFNTGLPGLDMAGIEYGDNPNHPLLDILTKLEDLGVDLVFCAGNCGDPCPDGRCGHTDTGPGRSIMGLNAHPSVLTVGEVRVDGVPIGQSSQGPGRLWRNWETSDYSGKTLAKEKPDLCAPSHFREADDAAELNTGTSAASGVVAGVLAALRSVPGAGALTPAQMRALLRGSAVKTAGQRLRWDPRLGHGVLNAAMALDNLRGHCSFTRPATV